MTILIATPENGQWRFDDDQPSTLTASAIPVKPPQAWFENPKLDGPTAITVTPDGRIYGHAAAWGVRHIGLPGCRTAPRSQSGYAYYRTGQVETADGGLVSTGRISMGGGHADMNGDLTAAVEHYDDVTAAVADVSCGEDDHGIWFAGALRPGVSPEQIRTLRASSVSGDWRSVDGRGLELCGILAVNVPGFSVPRANLAASGAEVTSLVAAGALRPRITIRATETAENIEEHAMADNTPTDTAAVEDEQVTAAATTVADVKADMKAEKGAKPAKADAADSDVTSQYPVGSLVSVNDGEFVGLVTDADDVDTVSVQIEVSRDSVSSATSQQKAMVSSAVQQKLRDRELNARFDEMFARVQAAEALASQAQAHARGIEAMADLDGIG